MRPDALISSTAVRALETAAYFAETMGFKKKEVIQVPELYHAPPKIFKEVIQALPDRLSTVAIFAHNPGITDMANELTQIQIDNMPTCSIFGVEAEVKSWKNFLDADKSFLFFYYPKAF
jgi:phosphohistidine phosphatase